MGASFPFATYRSGQREALAEIRAAFDGGKRVVILEAPTGSGKSALAVTLAREASAAYLVTAQILLQAQYLRDFPDLALMKGRANYACLVVDTHAAAAPCLLGRTFPACEDCAYFRAKDRALAADGTVMNYAYFLAETNHAGGFGPRELLVLDEAHNIEAALMRFVEVRLSDSDLLRAGVSEHLPQGSDPQGLIDAVADLAPKLLDRRRALTVELEDLPSHGMRTVEGLRVQRWLDGAITGLALLEASNYDGDAEWVVEESRDENGRVLSFKPVDVAAFAEPLLFRLGERILLMSATILDVPTYATSLGLDPEEVAVVRMPSTFPPARRPILVRPTARLTRHHLASGLPKIVEAVEQLMHEHPHDKGIVHAHSYQLLRALRDGLAPGLQARIVSHDDAHGRDDALARHLADPTPTVLITPSMTEGIDLADEAARWQAICKIPWPYLGDPQVAARRARDPEWYAWRTCLTVVQAYGRSVRSETDHAVTYLLDAGFPQFLRQQRQRLPEWFVEAIELDA